MLTLLIIVFGYLVTNLLLDNKWDFIEKFVIAISLGFGLTNLIATVWLVNYPLTRSVVLLMVLVLLILFGAFYKVRGKRLVDGIWIPKKFGFKKGSALNSVLVFFIVALTIFIFVNLIVWPPSSSDAIALYDFRGRFFAEGNTLGGLADMNRPPRSETGGLYDFSYPLFTSFVHAVLYLDGFNNPKWIYVIFSGGFVYLFYRFMRRNNVKKLHSLLLSLLVISQPLVFLVSRVAYTNMPYTFYFVSGVLFFYDWLMLRGRNALTLSTIFIVLSTQVRSLESFYFVALAFIPLLIFIYKEYAKDLIAAFVILLSGQFWFWIVGALDLGIKTPSAAGYLSNAILLGINNFSVERILEVGGFYIKSVSAFALFGLIFFVTLFAHVTKILKKRKIDFRKLYIPAFILLLILYTLGGSYFFSFTNESWREITGSMYRAMIPVLPLILGYSGLVFFQKKQKL